MQKGIVVRMCKNKSYGEKDVPKKKKKKSI